MKKIFVLGQPLTVVSFDDVYRKVMEAVQYKKTYLVFAMNVHILLELRRQVEFQSKHQNTSLIFADGVPLLWLAKWQGTPLPGRVSGTDLCQKILESNRRVFLVTATTATGRVLHQKFPHSVVGSFSPPFVENLGGSVLRQLQTKLKQTRAEIILMGVGPLKQEKWLLATMPKLKPAVVGVGVGSGLEILAGQKPRAPRFWRDTGFEWLWRLGLEPARLFQRYFEDMIDLLGIIFLNRLILKPKHD